MIFSVVDVVVVGALALLSFVVAFFALFFSLLFFNKTFFECVRVHDMDIRLQW